MHGLSQIHLTNKGVSFKVKMAEDVLYNEVSLLLKCMECVSGSTCMHNNIYMQAMVYLLQTKFNIEYDEAVSCHQDEIYPQ